MYKMEWTQLPATDQETYLYFHDKSFREDLNHAEEVILKYPKWSIISGYYSMHNITKFFLAKHFNIKINSPEIHRKTVEALEHFIKDTALKKRLLELLQKADEIYFNAERLKENILPILLKKGKQERGKAQYYSETVDSEINSHKASYFLDHIVKPYIKLLKGLME